LIIENIPADACNPESITEYFSQFGNLVNVVVIPDQHKAELEYTSHAEAKACHSSPEAIFGNRFVKVYWKPVEKVRAPPVPAEVLRANLARNEEKRKQALAVQAEKQKQLNELQKSTNQVIAKQMEEQQRVMEKLRNPNLSVEERAVLMKGLEMLQESIKTLMETASKSITPNQTPKPYKKRTYERKFALDTNQMDTDEPRNEQYALLQQLQQQAQAMGQNVDPQLIQQIQQLQNEVLLDNLVAATPEEAWFSKNIST
jgi:hypothetical protein